MADQYQSRQTTVESLRTAIKDLLDAHEQHAQDHLETFTNVRICILKWLEQLPPFTDSDGNTKSTEDSVQHPPTPPDSDRDDDEDPYYENEARRLRGILSADTDPPEVLTDHEEDKEEDDITNDEDESGTLLQNDESSTGTYNTFDEHGNPNLPQLPPRDRRYRFTPRAPRREQALLLNSWPNGKVRRTPHRKFHDPPPITGKRARDNRNDSTSPCKPAKSKTRTEEPENNEGEDGDKDKEEEEEDRFNPARFGHDGDRHERFAR